MDKKRIMERVHKLATVVSAIGQAINNEDFLLLDEALRTAEYDLAKIRQLAEEPPSDKPSEHPFQ